MFSVRRAMILFVTLIIAGLAFGAEVDPSEVAKTAGTPVVVDTFTEKITATFDPPTVALRADYGRVELDVRKVNTIDFNVGGENAVLGVSVTLMDKSHVTGSLDADTMFAVTLADGASRQFAATEVEQIRFLHPKETSLVALLLGLLTLTVMEVVLGVDNVIFLALQTSALPKDQQASARRIGLGAALAMRIGLLLTLDFVLGLTKPIYTLPPLPFFQTLEARGISWRDIILLVGGAFLIAKSVHEMHNKLETPHETDAPPRHARFGPTIVTIAFIDILFSLDSVITAVGMVEDVRVMIGAMTIAMLVMLVFAGTISRFVESRPTVKVLALSFLILIGVLLVADGLGQHIDKGYIYFAMAFAVIVEFINMRARKPVAPS